MATKSKMFRVAVEGATATDGRTIERNWIQEMAAGYNRATYGARVNMEHIRGYSPEPPFNAYGDVLALEAREVEIQLNGKPEKRLALYAEIEPTPALVEITKKKQKIYTSIEVAPNFASTGKAGLVGLAVTDTPASLATEALAFSTKADDAAAAAIKAGLDSRKQSPDNVFSAAEETVIEFTAEGSADDAGGLSALFSNFLKQFTPAPVAPPVQTPAAAQPSPAGGGGQFSPEFKALLETFATQADKDRAALTAAVAKVDQVATDFAALKTQLDATPNNANRRPFSAGDRGTQELTDC